MGTINLPSTQDLQRYVGAYIQYFHPHLPFMHIPTLSFDLTARPTSRRSHSVGGSGSLILSMAAIGALYEMEHASSRELFEMAKMMIKMYLEERRKEDVKRADIRLTPVSDHNSHAPDNTDPTPVWLVQAMLLNIIYGHNSADKTIGESSYNHCHALVSLAKAAELLTPMRIDTADGHDIQMTGDTSWAGSARPESEEHAEWLRWKTIEEKKRTLYVIYILQSLLISAYNHQPVLTNSEITLDLPCEEEFFAAESSTVFNSRGGIRGANQNRLAFGDALRNLLSSDEKQKRPTFNATFGTVGDVNASSTGDIKPSLFGCLILIHALHNTLWESRQRHYNKVWTNEETEELHCRMESALQAWKSVWEKHPHHGTTRPSPFGPLAADATPLLDLAFVRLYVNLCRSKEFFWARDWDGMANELARGTELVQHAEHSPQSNSDLTGNDSCDSTLPDNRSMSRRERHLRKAAFHAARSLLQSEKRNLTFADFNSRELPLTAALCAFDCAQVLAEWVATLQDRVGKYIGILGQPDVDITQMPAVMLLEEEDCKLLSDIQEILQGARQKLARQGVNSHGVQGMDHRLAEHGGYSSQILRIVSCMLDRAAVWPITHLTAKCLNTHGEYMRGRAEQSIMASD